MDLVNVFNGLQEEVRVPGKIHNVAADFASRCRMGVLNSSLANSDIGLINVIRELRLG